MKILLVLTSLVLTSCFHKYEKDPHWKYGQHVRYKVDPFYTLVCNGEGTVDRLEYGVDDVYYYITPDSLNGNYDCFNAQNEAHVIFERD